MAPERSAQTHVPTPPKSRAGRVALLGLLIAAANAPALLDLLF